uniref:Uncharacterized protein n=1 Tax=Arundo donax TaxID=35708 RepID=A0A0A9ABJ2_ARUDO
MMMPRTVGEEETLMKIKRSWSALNVDQAVKMGMLKLEEHDWVMDLRDGKVVSFGDLE